MEEPYQNDQVNVKAISSRQPTTYTTDNIQNRLKQTAAHSTPGQETVSSKTVTSQSGPVAGYPNGLTSSTMWPRCI